MKDPAFLFYPGDYLRDTQCLSENVQVAYDRIMCEHMRNICITQQQLKFFTKKLNDDEIEELKMVLTEIDGGWQITWVAESINKRRAYSESRRQNRSKKDKEDMINISLSYDKHMENVNVNVNENVNTIEIWPTFEDFWNEVIHKVGRDDTKAYWDGRVLKNGKKITHSDKEKIMSHYPLYASSVEDPQMVRRPKTYLYNSTWKDEIVKPKQTTGGLTKVTERRINDFLRSAGG